MAQSGTERVVAYVTPEALARLRVRAKREGRSVSAMAARLLDGALGDGPVLARDVEPASKVEGSVEKSTKRSGPAQKPSSPAPVSSVASAPSAPGPVSEAFERMGPVKPRPGECERALFHRKGEFCKACGEMQ